MKKTPINIVEFKGFSKSGKTTSIISIIRYLRKIDSEFDISIHSIKNIHIENFSIDTPGKNTWLMTEAGANPVVSVANGETAFLTKKRLSLNQIIKITEIIETENSENCDSISVKPRQRWVLAEGYYSGNNPLVLCVKNTKDLVDLIFLFKQTESFEDRIFNCIIAISGVYFDGFPSISQHKPTNLSKRQKFLNELKIEIETRGIVDQKKWIELLENCPMIDLKNNPQDLIDILNSCPKDS